MPVGGMTQEQACAAAVFLNSTPGRLLFMRHPARTLAFPSYSANDVGGLRMPRMSDRNIVSTLSTCWETTRTMRVPQYRDGECEVRRLWDHAVAEALGWDRGWLDELRRVLHNEPHVRGLGRNEYGA